MKNISIAFFFLLATITFVWTGCEEPPIYDDTPTIEWVSFSKDTIQQLSETVTFKFNFTDGDGDLGKDNDTTAHILLIDPRRTPNDTSFYQIPTIEPQGIISGISGTIEIEVGNLCCINPNNPLILCQNINNYFDPITFKIKIRDIAGRWSNEIETDPLYVKCF